MPPWAIALIIVGAVFLLFFLWFFASYNRLVRGRVQCKNAWKQIDVQLKRRYDLIPNLVEVVKDYMSFEKETLENVTKARNVAMAAAGQGPAAAARAEAGLTSALSGLYAVMEGYPELKANQNVSQLMEELSSTENKIAYSRQFYNDTVMRYNTATQVVPTNIVAGICGFQQEEYFGLDEDAPEREAPKVDLSPDK